MFDASQGSQTFDTIIIGSGPTGATLAKELARSGQKVLVVERGASTIYKESIFGAARIFDGAMVTENLEATRVISTGGSTMGYFGVADLPPLDKFKAIGIDLSTILESVRHDLPLDKLPDKLIGDQVRTVRDSAVKLGYAWAKKLMLVDSSKCTNGYTHDARWTAREFLSEAIKFGAHLITQATVKKVLTTGGRATGIEYHSVSGKRSKTISRAYGKNIVLAAGVLESPKLLRQCGQKNVADRGFYCDPCFAVYGLVPGLKATDTFVGSMDVDLGNGLVLGDANFSRTFYRLIMLSNKRLVRLLRYSSSIGVGVMVRDELGGSLKDDGSYTKNLTDREQSLLETGKKAAIEIVENAGGKHIFIGASSSAHVGGVIHVGHHIDTDFQTEIKNLYVCDGSVMPVNIRLSPTLTLVCLAKYLAKKLLN